MFHATQNSGKTGRSDKVKAEVLPTKKCAKYTGGKKTMSSSQHTVFIVEHKYTAGQFGAGISSLYRELLKKLDSQNEVNPNKKEESERC